jgi:5-methylcytosine-specific restriction enzyme A
VGSPGQGRWSDSPWLAVLDAIVTDSPTRGYYVAFLFPRSLSSVSLSLQIGTTAVRERVGRSNDARGELRAIVGLIRRSVPEWMTFFPEKTIQLEPDSPSSRAAFYEHGHAFGVTYGISRLPPEHALKEDLRRMIEIYRLLTARAGSELTLRTLPHLEGPIPSSEGEFLGWEYPTEYRLHRVIERNHALAKRAKRALGYVCQACGFDFEHQYGSELGHEFIEAHHITPLAELQVDRVRLDPRHDFAVLCSNCHRMIHRLRTEQTVANLRRYVFRRTRAARDT